MKKSLYILLFFSINLSAFAQNFNLTDTVFEVNDTWVSRDILFDFDKPVFQKESYKTLDSLHHFLVSNPNVHIEITNHCDERFSNKYSTCLTCKRAKAVEVYLLDKGITQERLVSKGMNDITPMRVNAQSEDEHSLNRRTEVRIIAIK